MAPPLHHSRKKFAEEATTWEMQKNERQALALGAAVPFQKRNFNFPSGVQIQLSLSASITGAGSKTSSMVPLLSVSLRSLVRLDLMAGMGIRTDQMDIWTCNEQPCAKWLEFVLHVVHIV